MPSRSPHPSYGLSSQPLCLSLPLLSFPRKLLVCETESLTGVAYQTPFEQAEEQSFNGFQTRLLFSYVESMPVLPVSHLLSSELRDGSEESNIYGKIACAIMITCLVQSKRRSISEFFVAC